MPFALKDLPAISHAIRNHGSPGGPGIGARPPRARIQPGRGPVPPCPPPGVGSPPPHRWAMPQAGGPGAGARPPPARGRPWAGRLLRCGRFSARGADPARQDRRPGAHQVVLRAEDGARPDSDTVPRTSSTHRTPAPARQDRPALFASILPARFIGRFAGHDPRASPHPHASARRRPAMISRRWCAPACPLDRAVPPREGLVAAGDGCVQTPRAPARRYELARSGTVMQP